MITLHVNDQEVANIMEGLSNLPLHKSFDTFISIRQQVMQQRQAPQGPQQGQQAAQPAAPPADGTADTSKGLPNGRDVPQQP